MHPPCQDHFVLKIVGRCGQEQQDYFLKVPCPLRSESETLFFVLSPQIIESKRNLSCDVPKNTVDG